MNKKQRIILSVTVTLIFFLITFLWNSSLCRNITQNNNMTNGYLVEGTAIEGTPIEGTPIKGTPIKGELIEGELIKGEPIESGYVEGNSCESRYNWYVWILFIIVSGGFIFWLFSDI